MNMSIWAVSRQVIRYRPGLFALGCLLWGTVHGLPVIAGLALRAIFDRISGDAVADNRTFALVAVLFGLEAARGFVLFQSRVWWMPWWAKCATWLRNSMLRSLLVDRKPPATRLPSSSGEAVSRFRDDVEDLLNFCDVQVDVLAASVFGVVAVGVMFQVEPRITLVVVLPTLAIVVVTRSLAGRIRHYRRLARAAAGEVTAFVGDLFSGVLALKSAGAEGPALARFRERNRIRSDAALKDRLCTDLFDTFSGSTVDITIGLVLLLAAPAMRRGDFTVGDLALFTAYSIWIAALPRWIGALLARSKQSVVSVDRMKALVDPSDRAYLVTHRPIYLHSEPPPVVAPPRPEEPFRRLDVERLACIHESTGRGIEEVSFTVVAGEMVVVTGAVGSGKTTLVRALLGLQPATGGTIRWNGQVVDEPGRFLVPPRAAYAAQVPRLFSESLADNILLGVDGDLETALRLAALDDDVAEMHDGVGTMVGPRGVRLSGGQVQRATAARALVHRPELLVVDDLSSALDVETERQLWDRLRDEWPGACLVVSHRRSVLARADRVIVLEDGRAVGSGSVDELLRTCAPFRRLWQHEAEDALSA
jgi:ATP-binding cassette, subfamily B, bacterial